MNRLFAGMAAALLAAILFLPLKVSAVSAHSAILLDADTGRVLYEKNADEKSLIASCTKIMTALVVCEQTNVLDRVRVPKEAVGIEGSSLYLREGQVLTVQQLLYGLMLRSGNDAAVALAIYCGGTVEGFAERMNDKAVRLGLNGTHFVNPHGLDAPDHYSTARDLAVLAAYSMDNPIFCRTVSTKTVSFDGVTYTNHNKLLWQLDGAEGVKTGYTKAAGRILVSSVSRQGRRLIAVTINDGNDWQDHKTLHETGFSRFSVKKLVSKGDLLQTAQVAGGIQNTVQLIVGEDFYYSLAQNEAWDVRFSGSEFFYAPLASGQTVGYAHIFVDGEPVGKVPVEILQGTEMIPEPKEKGFFSRLFGV